MRLVIDANQVDDIVKQGRPHKCRHTLVVAPLIWAEIVDGSRPDLGSRLQALREYDLLFGMDYADICTHLCWLNEDQIQQFVPVFPANTEEHRLLSKAFQSPGPEHFQRAEESRLRASCDRKRLLSWIRQRKKQNNDTRSRGEELVIDRFATIEEADLRLISGRNAPHRTCLLAEITENNARAIRAASRESLYKAILANPCLRRFLRVKITFDLAYLDQWSGDALNGIGDLNANRNDMPDILLALFPRDGDTILTNDKRLQIALRHCDPLEKVEIATWASYFQSLV